MVYYIYRDERGMVNMKQFTKFQQQALALIDLYLTNEFGEPIDYKDMQAYGRGVEVPLAYTTLGDNEEVLIQVYYDLEGKAFHYVLSGHSKQFNSVEIHLYKNHETEEIALYELECLDFDDLVDVEFDYSFMLD